MTMTTKASVCGHTKGPWVASIDGNQRTMIRAGDQWTGRRVATTFISGSASSLPENIANARLISAAPDMLDALKRCLEAIEHADSMSLPTEDIRAAIAKATA